MRFSIRVSAVWRPLFALFGFTTSRCYVEISSDRISVYFGALRGEIPLDDVTEVVPYRWPIYFGYGAKIGPRDAVSFVGSSEGVLRIRFREPRRFSVWGPFRRAKTRSVIVSLDDPEGFTEAVEAAGGA